MFKFKKIIFSMISASTLITTLVFAQTPYFQNPKKIGAPPANMKGVSSPADFTSQVGKINKQNQANFKQQLTQKISAIPAPKIQTPPESAFGKTTPPSSPAATTTPPKEPSTPTAEPEAPETTPAATVAPVAQQPLASPRPVTPAPTAPTPAPAKTPGYTGFGGGQSTNQPAGSQNNNSGGWNVKY